MQLLQRKAAQITTMQQFEECIAAAPVEHRWAMRHLLGQLITPGLPCCGVAMLAQRVGDPTFKHGNLCPKRNRVTLQ